MATINKIPNCPPLRFPDFNDDWKETTLGEATIIIMGQSPSSVNYNEEGIGLPLIQGNADMCSGTTIVRFYTSEITKEALKNDIIMSVRAPVGALAITPFRCCIGRGVCAIRANKYIYYYLQGCSKIWSKYSAGSTFDSITGENIRHLPLSLPSPAEQKKIADFLSLIDERINNLSETLRELKNQKAALLNQLFSQKLHFPDFNDEWTQTTLGEIAERVTRKNNGHVTSRPLTISAQYGLIDQRDFFNKIVASTSLEGYYLLNKGEFAYNRSSSADYPWGAIKRLESYENGALSTLYICFSLLQGYPSFIAHFFETSQWHEYIQSIAAEGARNHGLLNISVSDFFALPISLPTLEEQKKIADFLSLIDERIEVEEQLLQQYEKQKRYLLRQMFV